MPHQEATDDGQEATGGGEEATDDGQEATGGGEEATGGGEEATDDGQEATGGGEEATGGGEEATDDGEEATGSSASFPSPPAVKRRRSASRVEVYKCEKCGEKYANDDGEVWIGCSHDDTCKCDKWVHDRCVNIRVKKNTFDYYCDEHIKFN